MQRKRGGLVPIGEVFAAKPPNTPPLTPLTQAHSLTWFSWCVWASLNCIWASGAASCLLLILAAIIYWQIREIDRVLSKAGSDADDLNFELLSHISPIGWDNVLLYGEYQLNRSLVRSERLSV